MNLSWYGGRDKSDSIYMIFFYKLTDFWFNFLGDCIDQVCLLCLFGIKNQLSQPCFSVLREAIKIKIERPIYKYPCKSIYYFLAGSNKPLRLKFICLFSNVNIFFRQKT